MAQKRKYNWDQIADEYICGGDDVTQKVLCERYGCAPGVIGRVASQQMWSDRRSKYRAKVHRKTLEKAAENESAWKAKQIAAARALMDKALTALEALDPEELSPQEIRLFITAACSIEHTIMTADPQEDLGAGPLDHEERVERLFELLRARGAA